MGSSEGAEIERMEHQERCQEEEREAWKEMERRSTGRQDRQVGEIA